jgi:hypothetical protein
MMQDDATINRMVAARLGWKAHPPACGNDRCSTCGARWIKPGEDNWITADFVRSLDAMAMAEASLSPDEKRGYLYHIDKAVGKPGFYEIATAAATTRALAFLAATGGRP